MSGRALRAIPAPARPSNGRTYNKAGRLHTLGARTAELSAAVREALGALDAGRPGEARDALARVAEPDAP